MIEKLDIKNGGVEDLLNCIKKINELVDGVNAIQKEREAERFEIQEWIGIVSDLRSRVPVVESRVSILEEHAHPTAITEKIVQGFKNLQDPYAEQRKWVGKICRFWNDDESLEDSTYGKLVNIFDAPHEDCPFQCGYGEWYEHCEPVKPDDDIIYKGGDND